MENLKTIDHKKVGAAYYGKEEFDELYVFVKLNYLLEAHPDHLAKFQQVYKSIFGDLDDPVEDEAWSDL